MDECEFCRIVTGEEDAYVMTETDLTVAFLDAHPASRGHTLVVPKSHHEFLFRGGQSLPEDVFRTVGRVVRALNQVLDPDGVSLFHTSGPLAGTVSHAHVHAVPRYEDDDIHLSLERKDIHSGEAAQLARQLGEII